jgi:hypothetical protein
MLQESMHESLEVDEFYCRLVEAAKRAFDDLGAFPMPEPFEVEAHCRDTARTAELALARMDPASRMYLRGCFNLAEPCTREESDRIIEGIAALASPPSTFYDFVKAGRHHLAMIRAGSLDGSPASDRSPAMAFVEV